jgi:GNAT superfamily N-acetyltransferase
MNIETCKPTDSEDVAAVMREAAEWLESKHMALWSSSKITPESVRLDVESGIFLVARQHETIVGIAKFQMEDGIFWPDVDGSSSAFIHRLAIRRSVAGQGVSSAILNAAVKRAAGLGKEFLRLDCVSNRVKLRAFYESFGFRFHSYFQLGTLNVARYEYLVSI